MKLDIRLWLCWSIKETRTTATPWNWCCYARVATGTVETELLLRSNNSLMLLMQERQKYACTVAFGIYIVTLCSLTHTHTHCHLVLWAWYITHTHTAQQCWTTHNCWVSESPSLPFIVIALHSAASLCCTIMGWWVAGGHLHPPVSIRVSLEQC